MEIKQGETIMKRKSRPGTYFLGLKAGSDVVVIRINLPDIPRVGLKFSTSTPFEIVSSHRKLSKPYVGKEITLRANVGEAKQVTRNGDGKGYTAPVYLFDSR